jgi:hypothetical protein
MIFRKHSSNPGNPFRCVWVAISFMVVGPISQATAEEFNGPNFRKGMWHFVRTLEMVVSARNRHRLLEREMTRCVDPTQAMKVTFSSAPVGDCHSAKPEKTNNSYTFSHRCDYMGPVRTVITVESDEAYTEVNELTAGDLPRTESVVARRIGDCHDDVGVSHRPSAPGPPGLPEANNSR